jgi:hypothetical protein
MKNVYRQKVDDEIFLDAIDLPPLAHLDTSLMNELKFHARFLVIYAAKMKKDRVLRDQS